MPYKDPEKAKQQRKDYYIKHKQEMNNYSREYRQNHLEELQSKDRIYYQNNKNKRLDYHHKWHQDNKNKVKNYNEQWKFNHPEQAKKNACNATRMWRERNPTYSHDRGQELKLEVLSHYSDGVPACFICGEIHIEFLTIDHVNGGGKNHRKSINSNIYKWLKKNNYPKEYQVLCWNHNIGREYPVEKITSIQKSNLKLKLECLNYYSNQKLRCECCGENNIAHLCLDHINGNGGDERKKLKLKGGIQFYRYLRKHGYPSGYRVLCHNCNCSLGVYGYCPHNKTVK